ncbi:MAG: hypothetical protein B7Z55_13985 [Planctomycetales bacterium 12-60-4]|nr:MAG: hypothetical protein B7Z55_13985 [Planctomycetales bacterium 12-60-4]
MASVVRPLKVILNQSSINLIAAGGGRSTPQSQIHDANGNGILPQNCPTFLNCTNTQGAPQLAELNHQYVRLVVNVHQTKSSQ